MSEWLVALFAALIGAGAALAGSLISARSTRAAGERQAEAALHTLRLSLEEQRAVRVLDQRRQTYVRFLEAADAVAVTRRTGEGQSSDLSDLQRAYGVLLLEGPAEPAAAAHALMEAFRKHASLGELDTHRREFIESARTALSEAERGAA
ncbi:hypothetical protein CLM62_03135 [Streptomyces sp. SA15]|uniref:hypothetical protein n=1 Tax=Streptomyces sp. SA15 TaxID=934019 RepID=UPI000BB02D66|nr:hypothetical protein [Streptomyces sp. SA15]PAZ17264.1 hypothetical protein CLM62_03135 [Streptomyces sp. SA15]